MLEPPRAACVRRPRDRRSPSKAPNTMTTDPSSEPRIDLYYWPTPNCWKITILCEEVGIPYRIVPTNILDGAQFVPEYGQINPFPQGSSYRRARSALAGGPIAMAESVAILLYLAGKKVFLDSSPCFES